MKIDNASENLSDRAEDFVKSARKTYDKVVDRASDYVEGFNSSPTDFIRQHPMQAAVGGLVIGLLLGSAIGRRSIAG
jgi:ElaB/YqjD/DUF883 family membrane-anchored ribosome-binding protein